jgi:hypothetical protein
MATNRCTTCGKWDCTPSCVLYRYRAKKGLSIRALGRAVGDKMGWQVGKCERNERQLPILLAIRCGAVLDVPFDRLLTQEQRKLVEAVREASPAAA